VADKAFLEGALLGTAHKEAFASPLVEYLQVNLVNPAGVQKAFSHPGGGFNIIFNLAAETRYSQTDDEYREKILNLALNCANEATKHKIDKFVEVSTAHVYKSSKENSKENGKLEPWTTPAKFKLQTEEALRKIQGLPIVIVRPAIVYGPGDSKGICPRLVCGAIYKSLNKQMKILWTSDLKTNTVHVSDVSKALWHVAVSPACTPGSVWNLADKNDTNQGKINKLIEVIFGIKTGYISAVKCKFAKMNLPTVVDEINRRHLKPWSDIVKASGIENTPLSPYVEEELIKKKHLAVDGSAIEGTGFKYDYPHVTADSLREVVEYFAKQNLFPKF
jgi:nucleoside-diphosphate-sugar epimerase